ncbi:hypothetical protein C0995_004659, partial [Termitomyces sp. Mi166
HTWLRSMIAGYFQAKKASTTHQHLTVLYEDWFKEWPKRKAQFCNLGNNVELTGEQQLALNKAIEAHYEGIVGKLLKESDKKKAIVKAKKEEIAAEIKAKHKACKRALKVDLDALEPQTPVEYKESA